MTRRERWRHAVCALAVTLAACASTDGEIQLAPLWSRYATADGAVEAEALGGLWRQRTSAADGRSKSMTLGPLWSLDTEPNGDWTSHYVVPMGFARQRGESRRSMLLPIYFWVRGPKLDGTIESRMLSLPGIFVRSNDRRGTDFLWFPFYGDIEDFVTYERLSFVLFPLWARTERQGRTTQSVLFPFFAWTRGGGGSGFRVWPFYGRIRLADRYDRFFVLWPFYHHARNHLGGGGEQPEHTWLLFPLVGHTTRGTYRATTVLWPFFGYARDARSDFWALDAPWFLVRLQRGPGEIERTRFWPLWSHLRTDSGLEAWNLFWPLGHLRQETYPDSRRTTSWFIPFWQRWQRTQISTGERSSWLKVWPLYQRETREDWRRHSFPTLDPFWRNELLDRHFSWIWKLWEVESSDALRRERSWLGLWHGERDAGESRRSLTFLWSTRRYDVGGKRVRETSLLFGLLRWRVTEDSGFDMLRPAFPGPGWPLRRVGAEAARAGTDQDETR